MAAKHTRAALRRQRPQPLRCILCELELDDTDDWSARASRDHRWLVLVCPGCAPEVPALEVV